MYQMQTDVYNVVVGQFVDVCKDCAYRYYTPKGRICNSGHRPEIYGCSNFERGPAANRMVKYSTEIVVPKKKEKEK